MLLCISRNHYNNRYIGTIFKQIDKTGLICLVFNGNIGEFNFLNNILFKQFDFFIVANFVHLLNLF